MNVHDYLKFKMEKNASLGGMIVGAGLGGGLGGGLAGSKLSDRKKRGAAVGAAVGGVAAPLAALRLGIDGLNLDPTKGSIRRIINKNPVAAGIAIGTILGASGAYTEKEARNYLQQKGRR